jgi:hypothetical protein
MQPVHVLIAEGESAYPAGKPLSNMQASVLWRCLTYCEQLTFDIPVRRQRRHAPPQSDAGSTAGMRATPSCHCLLRRQWPAVPCMQASRAAASLMATRVSKAERFAGQKTHRLQWTLAAHLMAGWISKLRTRAGPAVRSDSCSRCRCTRRRTADCCLRPAAATHTSKQTAAVIGCVSMGDILFMRRRLSSVCRRGNADMLSKQVACQRLKQRHTLVLHLHCCIGPQCSCSAWRRATG